MPPSALFFSLAVWFLFPCIWLCMICRPQGAQSPQSPVSVCETNNRHHHHHYIITIYYPRVNPQGGAVPPSRDSCCSSPRRHSAEADYKTLCCNTQCGRHSLAASTRCAHCRGIVFRPTEQPQILRSCSGMWSTPACGIKEKKHRAYTPLLRV